MWEGEERGVSRVISPGDKDGMRLSQGELRDRKEWFTDGRQTGRACRGTACAKVLRQARRVAHTFNSSSWETEACRALCFEFWASQNFVVRPRSQKNTVPKHIV